MKQKYTALLSVLLLFIVQFSFAQEKTISGNITDDNGVPLPGVNIIIKNTNSGTQSDFDGNYSINAAQGSTLVYSYVGFELVERRVGLDNTINLSMVPGAELSEVVVVAYGTQTRTTVPSAISIVKAETIEQVPVASIDQVLQGQAAGLNVQTSSGQPGASGTILIRGRASLLGDVEPLFVIDGIPVNEDNFRSINANDIESISILKDASGSALYGNRASGGVIIVTTKKGKFDAGTSVSYRSLYGVSSEIDPNFEVLSSRDYLSLQRDNGITNVAIGDLGNLIGISDTSNPNNPVNNWDDFSEEDFQRLLNAVPNTNWRDTFFRQAKTNSQEVTISTGSESAKSYNSIAYFEQEGITRRSKLQRFNVRNNTTAILNKKLTFSSNLTANYSKSQFNEDSGTGQLDNPFLVAYLARPETSPFDSEGNLDLVGDGTTGFSNLPAIALSSNELDTNEENELKIVGDVSFKYDVTEFLSAGIRTGLDYQYIRDQRIINPLSLRGVNNNTGAPAVGSLKGSQFEGVEEDAAFNTNLNLTYTDTYKDKHNLEVSVFTEYYKRNRLLFGYTGFGINPRLIGSGNGLSVGTTTEDPAGTPDDPSDDIYPYIPTNFSVTDDLGLFSYFGVLKYNYDKIFGVQGSLRRDGTSRFAKENRFGTFYSGSVFVNVHKMNFMDNVDFVDELKLRGSYGLIGNQNIGGSTLAGLDIALDLYAQAPGYQQANAFFLNNIGNRNAKWEESEQTNIGVDFGFLNRRLSGSVDVYRNKTNDVFFNSPVSATSSVTSFNTNIGDIQNQGLEISLSYDIVRGENFQWSVNGNIAFNQSEVLALPDPDGDGIIPGTGRTALAIGKPIGSFYLVRWAGVNPANGKPLYLDIDGNVTDVFSEEDRVILDKTRDPKYTGGFGTNLNYKKFFLTSLFTFAGEQYRNNGSYGVLEAAGNAILAFSNGSQSLQRAWQEPGDITDIPALEFNSTRLQLDDRLLEDASFLRLRNVTLGYTLDGDKSKLFKSIKIYLQGQNLLTFSKWRGFDPESNLAGTFFEFPTPRTYTVGMDVNF